jgi:hypothetical protein
MIICNTCKEKFDYIQKSYNIIYGDVKYCKRKLLELIYDEYNKQNIINP